MTDELLLRRLRIGWHDDDTPIWVSEMGYAHQVRAEGRDAVSDLPYQLSPEHRALVWRMSNPTPQSVAAFNEQVAAYVKGESHE